MNLAELRRTIPELEGLDDDSAVDAIHQAYYPDLDRQKIADRLGVKAAPVQEPDQPRGLLRGAADLGIEAVSGVARGVKFTADAFGADNAVSSAAGDVDTFAREYLSAKAKQDDKRIGQIMADAEDAGIWEQVKAAAQAFTVAPARMAVNALGTSVPTIGAALLPGVGQAGAGARLGMLAGMGAAQGAGTVKGSIYERVKAQHEQAGETPEDAAAAAQEAQEYGGQNNANIMGGAALGGAASSTGAQPIIARLLSRQAAQGVERGVAARTALGVVKEAPLEAAQGGQEQYAGNVALQNEGFDTPTWRGVAGNAALEGMASAPMGGITGALDRQSPAVAAQRLATADNVEDMITAANDLASGPVGNPAPLTPRAAGADAMAWIRQLDPEQQSEAIGLLGTAGNMQAPGHVRRFAQNRLDELLAPLQQIPTGEATEMLPVGEATELAPAGENEKRAQATLKRWMADAEPVDEARANEMVGKAAELGKGEFAVVPHTRGGFTVVPKAWLTPGLAERLMAEQRASQWEGGKIPVGESAEMVPTGDVVVNERKPRKIPAGEATELDVEQVEASDPNAPPYPARTPKTQPARAMSDDDLVREYVAQRAAENTPASRAFVQDFKAGRITPADVLRLMPKPRQSAAEEANDRLAKAASQAPTIQPGDLLTVDGMPYGTKSGAAVRATREGGGDVVQVPGGFVVRKESASESVSNVDTDAQQVAAADSGRGVDLSGSQRAVGLVPAAPGRVDNAAEASQGGGGTAEPVADGGRPDAALSDDIPTLKKQWAEAAQAGQTERARQINDRIVEIKKNPEQRTASPVAESPSPAQEGSDGEVANTQASGAPDSAVMPAGLRVTFGGKTYPVESINDAQEKWIRFQESADSGGAAGVSQVGNGVPIIDGAGRLVARVAFNGRAFGPNDELLAEAPDATAPTAAVSEAPKPAPPPPLRDRVDAKRQPAEAAPDATAPVQAASGSAAPAPVAVAPGITTAIEGAKRRLRETRNQISKLEADPTASSRAPRLSELKGKENAIEREIRELRKRVFDDEPAPTPAADKPAAAPLAERVDAKKKTFAEMAQDAQDAVPGYLGRNTDGEIVYEDKRGVRSILRDGVRVTESVAMRPTRDGVKISVEHKGEFLTAEEAKAAQDARPDPIATPAAPVERETTPAAEPALPVAAPKPAKPPKSFRKKVKVTTPVFVEETASFESREIDADTALKALDEDINEMDAFMKCLKG